MPKKKVVECQLCHMIIGKERIHTEPYYLYTLGKTRVLCEWCYDDLLSMAEPNRSLYFRNKREFNNKKF